MKGLEGFHYHFMPEIGSLDAFCIAETFGTHLHLWYPYICWPSSARYHAQWWMRQCRKQLRQFNVCTEKINISFNFVTFNRDMYSVHSSQTSCGHSLTAIRSKWCFSESVSAPFAIPRVARP